MVRLEGTVAAIHSLTLADADELLALRIRNRRFFTPYEPVLNDDDFTAASIRRGIEQGLHDEAEDRGYAFAIRDLQTAKLVGRIRLSNVFRGPWQNATLGYYIDEASNGRGFATDAVALTTRFAFENARLHRVQAGVRTDNPRSMRVLEKNAFRREGIALRYLNISGEWRDHVIFAKTVEEA
jgi:ribosomal-protein-alanine N-acetyltransferase